MPKQLFFCREITRKIDIALANLLAFSTRTVSIELNHLPAIYAIRDDLFQLRHKKYENGLCRLFFA